METSPFRFGLILLAAGGSARMGRPKQLLPVAGRTLLRRAAEAALASAAWPVVVVLGAQAEALRPELAALPVQIALNPDWEEGMASSIRAGVTALRNFSRALDAALIALCDQPHFSSQTIARLVDARRDSGRPIAAAADAGRLSAPALFDRRYFDELLALQGAAGARGLLARHADEVRAVALPELALDLDTPEDYRDFLTPPSAPP